MSRVLRVRVIGPLAGHAKGFQAELRRLEYTPLSAANQLRVMADLSRWLVREGLQPSEVTPERVEGFLAARRSAGYTGWLSARGLGPMLRYLRSVGAVPELAASKPTPVERLLAEYDCYLRSERGLAPSTVRHGVDVARLFLARVAQPSGELDLSVLDAATVVDFVTAECVGRGVGAAKNTVTGLRSVLRYLHLQGFTAGSLASAVPPVAGWRGGSLPRSLPSGQVARMLAGCDRRRRVGRRDFAVLLLLTRLGLRAGEVAALELGDVDWRAGELVVRGKARREERLPLPADVGEAIVAYLRVRGHSQHRALFLHSRAPHGPITDGAVKAVVRATCRRAGLAPVGAHRLRHSAATEMLRAGASLAEIGQVLRHREPSTTAIYAKVDRAALRELALPWPGGAA